MPDNFANVNHLVLNFYPDGYSIAVKLNEFPVFTSETILETAKISYAETSLLDYIENEELPPLLVDTIDSSPKLSKYKIWHNGCLILEVRDKINLSSDVSSSINFFIRLKPTNLSMLYDVLNLTGSNCWTDQDRLQLESQIVLHNSPLLYLEPGAPSVCNLVDGNSNNNDNPDEDLRPQARLKSIYSSRANFVKFNVGANSNKEDIDNNFGMTEQKHNQATNVRPPPELTLQQFLANRRAKRKTQFPLGNEPRFHRYKIHHN